MSSTPVYLDYAATTPVDPRVADVMVRHMGRDGVFGNPASSDHAYGTAACAAVEQARERLAAAVNARAHDLIWTSGATEADNLAIKGVVHGMRGRGSRPAHVVTATTEHKAVTDPCRQLERQGARVTWLAPDTQGLISPGQVTGALNEDTVLVSVMLVNNETGVIQDIAAIGRALREHPCLFHVDAAQALGRLPIDLEGLGVDLMSFSGHKLYGPKGIGALYVRRSARARLAAQIHGGGHERGLRSGTLPTHQIAGMGEAARLAVAEMEGETARIRDLTDRFMAQLEGLPGVHLNGHRSRRVPHIMNFTFEGVDGEALMADLAWRGCGLAVSSGAACSSAARAPSHVLRAMGLSDEQAEASVRFSLGRYNTDGEVETAAGRVTEAVQRLRAISPLWKEDTAA